MKLNKLFMVLAATAIVSCTSDELNDFSANQAPEQDSRLIELDENFAIAGVGVDAATTRTHWEQAANKALVNKFLPILTANYANGDDLLAVVDVLDQAVGLCWLGNGAVGTDVYTNYQFYHYGWLNKGQTKAEFECGDLTNGALYSEITFGADGAAAAGDEPDENDFTLPSPKCDDGLNYNSGVYKTDNKAIFGGDYIVYYPFNGDFKDAGTIPAIAETTFDPASESFDTPELGKATFRYSAPVTIEGGDQAADFGMYNLSSLVQLRVATPSGVDLSAKEIDQIVLYSASEKLLKQANLAADKIVAGKKGAELYASSEGTKTIVANFAAPVALKATDQAPKSAYITVLPTTVNDLKVLVHRTDGKWAQIDKANTVFEAGKAKRLDVTVVDADFTANYIAVDEASLTTALTEARAIAAEDKPQTITVIGDITLESAAYNIINAKDAYITITGDDIIVPEDVTLTVATNMASDVRVLGKSCCDGAQGGRLIVQGGTINNLTMEETEAKTKSDLNNPAVTFETAKATVAAGKTFDVQAGNVYVDEAVDHKGNIQIAEGAKVTVSATGGLKFMGSTVVNDGTIEVKKAGQFNMTHSDGSANASAGKNMTNNGTFIHNVDAGVGTAVQLMQQNGEYRCKVNAQDKLDDAFLQWTACSVIEMVNDADYSYDLATYGAADATTLEIKHNGKYINFEVNTPGVTTAFNNPGAEKGDNKVINIGNLTVTAATAFNIDYTNATAADKVGQRTLNVNGDMLVKATTNINSSKKVTVSENLTVEGVTLKYVGGKYTTLNFLSNLQGLAVTKDITVSKAGKFDASDDDAINITCANFTLTSAGTAEFGNRTGGGDKTMTVSGAISNPKDCTFDVHAAGASTLLAWITCTQLNVGGTFTNAEPSVVAQ